MNTTDSLHNTPIHETSLWEQTYIPNTSTIADPEPPLVPATTERMLEIPVAKDLQVEIVR